MGLLGYKLRQKTGFSFETYTLSTERISEWVYFLTKLKKALVLF